MLATAPKGPGIIPAQYRAMSDYEPAPTDGQAARPMTYRVNGTDTIEGVANAGATDERIVFTLTHDDNGTTDDPTDDTFTLNLNDQLDPPYPDATDGPTGDDQILTLNLIGSIIMVCFGLVVINRNGKTQTKESVKV